jgi:hypothetical protein
MFKSTYADIVHAFNCRSTYSTGDRTPVEPPSNAYRTPVERLSNACRTPIERLSNACRTIRHS